VRADFWFEEQITKRRVAAVLQRLLGTKRESLILNGFKKYRTQHGIFGKNEGERREALYLQGRPYSSAARVLTFGIFPEDVPKLSLTIGRKGGVRE
jgi:hypothetical protein